MNNPNNKLITKTDVENILNKFGNIGDVDSSGDRTRLEIKNLEFYQGAFIHESYHQSVQNYIMNPDDSTLYLNYISKESSERMEYMGDNVLKTILGRYLYDRYPDEREGFLTRLKIKIEKCSMLHKIAVSLGFKDFLLLSLQIENQTIMGNFRGRHTQAYFEDAFEAFLGSIMEDFGEYGYLYADRFLRNIIETIIDFSELISQNDNFKDSIQRYWQNLKFHTPMYININQQGPLYRKIFTRLLYVTKNQYDILSSVQKKNIKQYTYEVLEYYQINYPDIYNELHKEISKNNYILCIGSDTKVVSSEQKAARIGLINLGLDQDY